MTLDDAIDKVQLLEPAPADIIAIFTSEIIDREFVQRCHNALVARGMDNLLFVLSDESDIMTLNTEMMARWGWKRIND